MALYFQLKWGVVAQPDDDSQSIVRTDPDRPLVLKFCIWDIGANTVPARPFPEKTKNLPVCHTNYQLFPNKEKNAKRKAAEKKVKGARRESERASTLMPADGEDWEDELD